MPPAYHFPTPIFQHEVPGFEALNEKLLRLIERLQAEDPTGVRRSNYGGWHSSDKVDIRELTEFSDLKNVILEEAAVVTAGMGFEGLGLVLSKPWFVVSPAGAMNARHCHPRSFLSGAYYVKVPPGSSPLCFHDPRPVKLHATPAGPAFKVTPYTAETLNCQVREGLLVLFPAWLDHSVPPHQTEAAGRPQFQPRRHVTGDRVSPAPRYSSAGGRGALGTGRQRGLGSSSSCCCCTRFVADEKPATSTCERGLFRGHG